MGDDEDLVSAGDPEMTEDEAVVITAIAHAAHAAQEAGVPIVVFFQVLRRIARGASEMALLEAGVVDR